MSKGAADWARPVDAAREERPRQREGGHGEQNGRGKEDEER